MESEVREKEMARPTYVEDLPIPKEGATKESNVEKKKVAGTEVKIKKGASKESESKSTCELQITEELDEFAEVGLKKNNDTAENPTRPVSKPTKRSITESKPVPKTATVKKKLEPKNVGPVRDDDAPPWNGITLNRCLVVAAFLALLSVGFQVVQDAVDMDDELAEVEAGLWTPHDTTDQQQPEPWFFEGWFSTSPGEEPDVMEDPEEPGEPEELEEPEELKEPEETELPETEDELAEAVDVSETQEPLESKIEDKKESQDKPKQSHQWGLKPKNKYMETKAIKIRRASEGASRENVLFPFMKRPKETSKHPRELQEKAYKDKGYKKKDKDKQYEHPKKQEDKKQYKKRKEEPNKYVKHDKERKEEKDKKRFKEHQQERGYRKQHDVKHHG
ncbi:junctional sarcoplasmic reticulum protein 1 [Spea bombifrons]|uniref:junctional sarcoplasmic reticulum protein 1 n=1 Tax=Spea bombifrons TaxID=233779 RepID=UPI00234913D8|nr:junctional sarcoplasmic reticulum protein 1 [Spea bombifrons]XP_053318446.1 junctional sarcoplasmic reticulum protein 1 [Spea bombifrons]